MFEKPQHPDSFFLSPTHTPTLGLAGSREEADPMVHVPLRIPCPVYLLMPELAQYL